MCPTMLKHMLGLAAAVESGKTTPYKAMVEMMEVQRERDAELAEAAADPAAAADAIRCQ